ncbi:hypothetical protein GGE65_008194 [Skermanella aerolata]|uniref:hypothetical protein n=1 Tax=Skermanella aerolata TaxID=393310 RepID=UPI003D1CE393
MEGPWAPLATAFRHAVAHWATVSATGTFALYLFGYLSLRYKLTALGIGADLGLIDERYLFEGIRFLAYIVSIFPNLILLGLILALPAWLVYRLTPSAWRQRTVNKGRAWRGRARMSRPEWPAILGIVLSLMVIQVLMRKIMPFSNLLLLDRKTVENFLQNDIWLFSMMVCGPEGLVYFYFHALVSLTIIASLLHMSSRYSAPGRGGLRLARGTLVLLLGVQILLLPINFGVLVSASQAMPRVRPTGEGLALASGGVAWLVWESPKGVTYLIDDRTTRPDRLGLFTVQREKAPIIEIIGYDSPMRHILGSHVGCGPASPNQAAPTETRP